MTADKFLHRVDRPGTFTSRCLECRRLYQRARQVTVAALDNIRKVGINLVLDGDSNIVGLKCDRCDQPFEPGQDLHADTTLRHVECPAPKGP